MMKTISLSTEKREQLIDITPEIKKIVDESKIKDGLCSIYSRHTTSAITINENDDPCVCDDVVAFMKKAVKKGGWSHDMSGRCDSDGNTDSHIKASIVGPSETVPVKDGRLLLGTWQGVYFCEFDGPRNGREIIVTMIRSNEE